MDNKKRKYFIQIISSIISVFAVIVSIFAINGKQLENIQLLHKSVWLVYDYLRLFPVTSISCAAAQLGSSFNSIANALHLLRENGIITQKNENRRNRIWEYTSLVNFLVQE